MLLAEIHGKSLGAARDSEDYLTSAVFGHLRYVPPHQFWMDLFAYARGLPGPDGQEPLLAQVLAHQRVSPDRYHDLQTIFWRPCPPLGEPDLLLFFTGGDSPPLALLVEVKLWSEKSGKGEQDQLIRYLRILDDLEVNGVPLPNEAHRYLVYLTPRDSLAEVEESLAHSDRPETDRVRLFRLRWQDVADAAAESSTRSPEPTRTILADVSRFLRALGLEHFDGFRRDPELPFLHVRPVFDRAIGPGFRGLTRDALLPLIEVEKARWVR